MVNVIRKYNFTVTEVFESDNTCILEDGRIAFCPEIDNRLVDKVDREGYILCFTIDDDGETNLEYVEANTPAISCNVAIEVK